MRVLHLIGPLEVGGAQTQLLGLLREGHGRYWEATLCGTSPGPMADDFGRLGIPVIELRRWGSPGLLRIAKLRRLLGTQEFDVIHANLWQSNAYARAAVVGRRDRPAVVISERNIESTRARSKRWLDARLARWTDVYTGNSDDVADFVARVHPVARSEVRSIPNAVDRRIFHPLPPAGDATEERAVLRVGAMGRLHVNKAFDVLIEAGRRLSASQAVEIVIAGDGPERETLQRLASGTPARFLGRLEPGTEVANFLRGLDVFVLPSRYNEGRPNVLLEALACGTPIVTTDIPGSRELVGAAARLVPRDDPEALAEGIADAAVDPNARERSLTAAEAVPDFDDLARQYRAVFDAALGLRS